MRPFAEAFIKYRLHGSVAKAKAAYTVLVKKVRYSDGLCMLWERYPPDPLEQERIARWRR
jgi:hypothetical protein